MGGRDVALGSLRGLLRAEGFGLLHFPFIEGLGRLVPILAQVAPGWVLSNDESDFLNSRPAFQLLFASDSGVEVAERFEVNEVLNVVTWSQDKCEIQVSLRCARKRPRASVEMTWVMDCNGRCGCVARDAQLARAVKDGSSRFPMCRAFSPLVCS
jgi:hypothetical protein